MSTERLSAITVPVFLSSARCSVWREALLARLRELAWGIDGIALVVAAALLAVHFSGPVAIRRWRWFLVFIAGEALVLSGSA